MILSRTLTLRTDIPKGAEPLYHKQGSLFILTGAKRDFSAENPWEPDNWNLTAQGRFVSEHGMAFAAAFAKMAGTKVGGARPKLVQDVTVKQYILTKKISDDTGTQGTSGDGPPV